LPDIKTERGLISIGWDNLEYELRKPEFWGFLGFSENESENSKDDNENLPDIETERGLISIGWDNLEYELRKPDFWGFLGFSENDQSPNFKNERYQTRIDFLLDFHFNKKSNGDNKLASFIELQKELKNAEKDKFAKKNVKQIWESIQLDLWKSA